MIQLKIKIRLKMIQKRFFFEKSKKLYIRILKFEKLIKFEHPPNLFPLSSLFLPIFSFFSLFSPFSFFSLFLFLFLPASLGPTTPNDRRTQGRRTQMRRTQARCNLAHGATWRAKHQAHTTPRAQHQARSPKHDPIGLANQPRPNPAQSRLVNPNPPRSSSCTSTCNCHRSSSPPHGDLFQSTVLLFVHINL